MNHGYNALDITLACRFKIEFPNSYTKLEKTQSLTHYRKSWYKDDLKISEKKNSDNS